MSVNYYDAHAKDYAELTVNADMIVQYLKKYGKARKHNFRELLMDKLPDILDDEKKNRKISTLLTTLRQKGIITTDSPNQQISNWILVEPGDNSNKKQ